MFNVISLWFKNTFGFSQKEINGFIILLILMVLMLLAPLFFTSRASYSNLKNDQAMLDSILATVQMVELENKASSEKYSNKYKDKNIVYKNFDPNNCTLEEWKSFGIKEKLAIRIRKYVSNGGQFRKKEDLKKIYGFPEKDYNKLFEYIALPEKPIYNKTLKASTKGEVYNTKNGYKKKEIVSFEINSCSAESLTQIRGIGEKLSERIIKYRDKLGGFHSEDQLYGIYGLDSLVAQQLVENTTIDKNNIKKININTALYEELSNHLLIDSKTANAIINYRKQHGNYTSVEDLSKIYSIKKEMLESMKMYLSID